MLIRRSTRDSRMHKRRRLPKQIGMLQQRVQKSMRCIETLHHQCHVYSHRYSTNENHGVRVSIQFRWRCHQVLRCITKWFNQRTLHFRLRMSI